MTSRVVIPRKNFLFRFNDYGIQMPISFMNSMSFCDLEIFSLGEWGYAWEDTLSHFL